MYSAPGDLIPNVNNIMSLLQKITQHSGQAIGHPSKISYFILGLFDFYVKIDFFRHIMA